MHRDRQLRSLKRRAPQIQRAVALVRTYDTPFGAAGFWSRDPDSKEEVEWRPFPPFLCPLVMKRSLTQIKCKDSKIYASVASASKCLRNILGSTPKVLILQGCLICQKLNWFRAKQQMCPDHGGDQNKKSKITIIYCYSFQSVWTICEYYFYFKICTHLCLIICLKWQKQPLMFLVASYYDLSQYKTVKFDKNKQFCITGY